MLRRTFLSLVTTTTIFGLTALAGAQDKPTVKVGALFPLTGIGAAYGQNWKIAVDMAVEEVNKTGINGSKLEVVIQDDQLNVQQAVLLFRQFASSDVVGVIGPNNGTSWEVIAPLANQLELLATSTAALKAGVTKKPWALRVHPADDTLIPEGVAQFKKAFPEVKRVVITGDVKEASGAGGMENFAEAVAANGLEVVETVDYTTRTTDFSPVAIKIRGLNPDAVLVSSLGTTSLQLLKELETQGYDKPILVSALSWAGPLINAVGSAGKNLYAIGYDSAEETGVENHDAFYKTFLDQASMVSVIPQPPNVSSSVVSYDAVLMMAQVLRDQGIDGNTPVKEAREKFRDGMNALQGFKGVNTFKMRDTGDGHLPGQLMKADGNVWKHALPAEQRTPMN